MDQLVDVTGLLLPNIDPGVYRIPVTRLSVGDLIVISDDPLSVRYVLECEPEGELVGLDPDTGDVVEFVPIQVPFLNCFVRVISLVDLLGGGRLTGRRRERVDEGRGRRRAEEGPREFDEALLLLLLSGQQPGQTGTPDLLNLLLLTQMGCREGEGNLMEWLLLSGMLQQTPQSGTTQPGTTQPAQSNPLALLMLAMLEGGEGIGGGLFRRRWRRDQPERREPPGPVEPPEPAAGPPPADAT